MKQLLSRHGVSSPGMARILRWSSPLVACASVLVILDAHVAATVAWIASVAIPTEFVLRSRSWDAVGRPSRATQYVISTSVICVLGLTVLFAQERSDLSAFAIIALPLPAAMFAAHRSVPTGFQKAGFAIPFDRFIPLIVLGAALAGAVLGVLHAVRPPIYFGTQQMSLIVIVLGATLAATVEFLFRGVLFVHAAGTPLVDRALWQIGAFTAFTAATPRDIPAYAGLAILLWAARHRFDSVVPPMIAGAAFVAAVAVVS